jgi:hypothetical protein
VTLSDAARTSTLASPNSALQRTGTDKVTGRGLPSHEVIRALRARVLRVRRAAAELDS